MPINICEQTVSFLACFAVGLVMGIFYDMCGGFRAALKLKKFWIFILDSFYWVVLTVVYFAAIYITCGGEARWYIFVGLMLGLLFYILSVSCRMRPFFEKLFHILFKVIDRILKIFMYPVAKLFGVFLFIWNHISKIVQPALKKIKNFGKNAVEKTSRFVIKLNRYSVFGKNKNNIEFTEINHENAELSE